MKTYCTNIEDRIDSIISTQINNPAGLNASRAATILNMRKFYTVLMYLLTPVILLRLSLRGFRAPAYFKRWKERFGFFKPPEMEGSIWIHAVSLGEFNAALPLIRALITLFPQRAFVVTTITPTGSDQVIKELGDSVFHVYLPYDLPSAVKRFLSRVKPCVGVVMETEIWPNLFFTCSDRDIPIIVANARLSEKSLKGYRPGREMVALALNSTHSIAAQTETDYKRLIRLGGNPELLHLVGSLKFDLRVSEQIIETGQKLRQNWGKDRFVVIAASTHEDDETPLLEAFPRLLANDPNMLLIIAPRHPERFSRVIVRCKSQGYNVVQRSSGHAVTPETQIFVVDTLGELLNFYAGSDIAFIGGSLAEIGGHNVLEPATLGIPVLVGPHTFNFAEVTKLLLDKHGAHRVHDAQELGDAFIKLHKDDHLREQMGRNGLALVEENRGALERTVKLVQLAMQTSSHCQPAKSPA